MWGWIKPLLLALLSFFWGKRNEPKTTIEDAKTPEDIAAHNAAEYDRWLREHQKK